MYQVGYVSEKLLGKVSKLRKRSGNSLLFLIEMFTPAYSLGVGRVANLSTTLRARDVTFVHQP